MTSRNWSGASRVLGTAVPLPALLTSTSTRPNSVIAASTMACASSGRDTSAVTVSARRPRSSIRARVCSRRSVRRAASTRSAPASASAVAKATPRPDEAPVTTATLSSRRKRSSTFVGMESCPLIAESNQYGPATKAHRPKAGGLSGLTIVANHDYSRVVKSNYRGFHFAIPSAAAGGHPHNRKLDLERHHEVARRRRYPIAEPEGSELPAVRVARCLVAV